MALPKSTRAAWINRLALLAFFLLISCSREQEMELSPQSLEQDTTWQGVIKLLGDIQVAPGVTLTIKPGTIIKFSRIDETSDRNLFGTDTPYYPQAELIVRGRLIARGTPKKSIVFTSAEIDPKPGDWGAVNLLGSDGNIIEYAKILFAYNGIHSHGSTARVSHSEFARNGVGISFKKEEETPDAPWFGKESVLEITHNRFANNKGGIGFRNAKAVISHNLIEDNKFFGIFPKEQAEAQVTYNEITGNKKGIYLYQTQGLRLEYNNIYDNTDYNIGVAEAQDYSVNAAHNWFGTTNTGKIDELIFDQQDDDYLGVVEYRPFLDKAVSIDQ